MKTRIQQSAAILTVAWIALLSGCAASPAPASPKVANAVRTEKSRSSGPKSATAAFFFEKAHASMLSDGEKCILLREEGRCPLCDR